MLSSVQESLSLVRAFKSFYNEIWGLELITELLSIHHSNERICYHILIMLQLIMFNLPQLCPNVKEEVIRSFIEECGGIELIDKILTEHKDNSEIRKMCFIIAKHFFKSKSINIFSLYNDSCSFRRV